MATEPECSTGTAIVGEYTSPPLETLEESIRRKLGIAISHLPSKLKVPQQLRGHNGKAYEPLVVSIGPFHRGSGDQFEAMEKLKQLYLDKLLKRMKISLEKFITRIGDEFRDDNETETGIIAFEKRARDFYAEPLDDFKQSDEFTKMMIRDACFVIQLVRPGKEIKDDDDPIMNMDFMFQYVCHDLLLLENQLPWFVLNCLSRLTLDSDPRDQFSVVLLKAFRRVELFRQMCDPYIEYLANNRNADDNVSHILELIRNSIVFSFKPFEPSGESLWCFAGKEEEDEENGLYFHPATALSEAGVIFGKGSAKNLMDIKFEKGALTIPQLTVEELTEPLFRNLIAFEKCCDLSQEITSYAFFMGKLISSESDMELLSRKKIIRNRLSVEDGFKFFNQISIDIALDKTFAYEQLCAELDKYSQVRWNKDVAQLKRDYFSSPWTTISLIVGIILLVITIFQFIDTIFYPRQFLRV
ncbi:unnamed protein product [Prunus brigantina]